MTLRLREFVRDNFPAPLYRSLKLVRTKLTAGAFEDTVLHNYVFDPDPNLRPRLTLVMPQIDPAWAFGGVTTGIDIFFDLCRRTGADARIITDRGADRGVVEPRAARFGVTPEFLEHVGKLNRPSCIPVRATDLFVTYNWWTTVNIRPLLEGQALCFGGWERPFIYLLQDYEPSFYEFSSTHMLARMALEQERPWWGVINSSQLHEFFEGQGHAPTQSYVFEPKISNSLRQALAQGPVEKVRRIVVYGRPTIPRNCFPAIERALRLWVERYPNAVKWEVVSAGLRHRPIPLGRGLALRSLGKLSLDEYADLLRTSAVGLSLMSSPHPSYPPLDMVHFGLLTVTNQYANKDLGSAHDNFVSVPDIDAGTLSDALREACDRFEDDPEAGWRGQSHMPAYLDPNEWPFLSELARDLQAVWERCGGRPAAATSEAPREPRSAAS